MIKRNEISCLSVPWRFPGEKGIVMNIKELIVNKTGVYLTCCGYKPCHILRYFTLYGEEYAEITTHTGKIQVKKWKVMEDR